KISYRKTQGLGPDAIPHCEGNRPERVNNFPHRARRAHWRASLDHPQAAGACREARAMSKRIRITPATRRMCIDMVEQAQEGWMFTPPQEPTRSLDANAKLHAMLGDISRQQKWMGQQLSIDDWKRLLVDAWARQEGGHAARVVPSLDGQGVVTLGAQTRSMGVRDMASLIESIYA